MDPEAFKATFGAIQSLDASEGPTRNIFEPRFQAREQAEKLRDAILNAQRAGPPTAEGQRQVTKVLLMLGTNHIETDEAAEGDRILRTAYALAADAVEGRYTATELPKEIPSIGAILESNSTAVNTADARDVVLWIETLNAIGVYLSNRPDVAEAVQDARLILHKAEAAYQTAAGARRDAVAAAGLLEELETLMTRTVFFLAQSYGAIGDPRSSSKYVHQTMVRQMKTKEEYRAKDWATNAVHLAGFYAGEGHFGCALHCLDAAKRIMPTKPADEETIGVVSWGLGKVWKAVLRAGATAKEENTSMPECAKAADVRAAVPWWENLPVDGLTDPVPVQVPRSFDEARDVFRNAVLALQDAAKYYTFDTCCPDHIAIHQDIADCYRRLVLFEPDVERQAAMLQRRVEATHPFPAQLSFQAYATLIRQLYYDLGEAENDLFELRLTQKEKNIGRPLTDRQLNFLCTKAMEYFRKFMDTVEKYLEKPIEKELHTPVFRVLMRIARLEGKRIGKTPEEEYRIIGKAVDCYDVVLKFVDINKLEKHPELGMEIELARQMKALLPNKQRDVQKVFNRR